MTKRRKKSKAKRKTTERKSTGKQSDLNKLKKSQSDLYARVEQNIKVILTQTEMSRDEFDQLIATGGYEALKEAEGFSIIDPIFEQMVKQFELYDKISSLVKRLEEAENKLFIDDLEKKTVDLEAKVRQMEKEESYYTEAPDREGMTKMRDKYYSEKEHWDLQKAEAETILKEDKEDPQALIILEEAKRNLKDLAKKRNWARSKNVMPSITKYSNKFSKAIGTVQKSVGEIGDSFGSIAQSGGGMQGGSKFEDMYTPEKIFGDYKPPKVGGSGKKKKGDSSSDGTFDGIDASF